jgi:hypothetical protein
MSYVPPSNPQQYPILFSPGEYGYFPSILPFEDDDRIDNMGLALSQYGTTPIALPSSPTTYTNTDLQKRQQVVYIKGDSNTTVSFNNQPARIGVAILTLNWSDFIVITFGAQAPNAIVQQLNSVGIQPK